MKLKGFKELKRTVLILVIAIISIMFLLMSCETEQKIDSRIPPESECLCVEVQELNIEIKAWTGGAWYYYFQWGESGLINDIDGCYTDEEINYMVRQVGVNERWYIVCENN